jgi:ketosteroid isomerase-like protein
MEATMQVNEILSQHMRFRIPLALVALVIGSACGGPGIDPTAEEAAVRARSEGVAAAEAAFDIEAAIAYWAEDAICQPAGVPQIQGKQAITDLYNQFFVDGPLKSFSGSTTHIEVSAAGDLAYEYGVNRMVLAGPDGDLLDMGKYLGIWKKLEGEWYIVALSFTSDEPAPVPLDES